MMATGLKNIAVRIAIIILLAATVVQAQTAPNGPVIQVERWFPWTGVCYPSSTPAGCLHGVWVVVSIGDSDATTTRGLSVTLRYTDDSGRLLVQTQEVVARAGANNLLFVLGITSGVHPIEFFVTTRIIGEVSSILTAVDPNNRGVLYYAGTKAGTMATSAIQNTWEHVSGMGVMVTTTFRYNDADSTGVLAVLNYEDGTSEARIAPRQAATLQATTWLPTTKPVKRVDLDRLVIGTSTMLTVPRANSAANDPAIGRGCGEGRLLAFQ